MKNTNIYIIGAGAIGKVLAVLLKLENKNVIIIRGSVDNKPSYTEHIEVELSDENKLEADIEITTLSNFEILKGLIVLTNKSYGNLQLAQELRNKTGDSPIIILQNGLDIEQPFIDNEFPEIFRGILFVASQSISENKLKYKPIAISQIGTVRSKNDNLSFIVELLNNNIFPFKAEKNIQNTIWKKAIVNCAFNSICPLLETDNGIFLRNKESLEIAKRVIIECIAIASEKGVFLTEEEVVENLLLISKLSDGRLISTYQDIINKRRTEIETLNFAFVNIAKKFNKEDKVVETKLLGELTKLKSELSQ